MDFIFAKVNNLYGTTKIIKEIFYISTRLNILIINKLQLTCNLILYHLYIKT